MNVSNEYKAWDSTETGYRPPDAGLAAGPNKNVQAINSKWGIFDQSTGDREWDTTLVDWFSNVIPNPDNTKVFDPRATYDYEDDRYLLAAVGKERDTDEGFWLLSASSTSNPYDTWYNTRIDPGDTSNWVDFPGLGFDYHGVVLTGNIYRSGSGYQHTEVIVIDKDELYSGGSFTYWRYTDVPNPDGSNAFTVQPADGLTYSSNQYLINSRAGGGGSLTLHEIRDPITSNQLMYHYDVDVHDYSPPPSANQPDTSDTLDVTDARLHSRAAFANGSVWVAHAIAYDWGDGDTESIAKWYEIDASGRSVAQQRGFGLDDGYFFFPAVAVDPATDDMMVVYGRSGDTSVYPGVRVAGRESTDPENELKHFTVVKSGESDYDPTSSSDERWGDYFAMSADATDRSYLWLFGEYAFDSSNDNRYGMWTARANW